MNKLKEFEKSLSEKYLEREEVIHGIVIGMISKMNILLIGEAGTGKSQLVRDVGSSLDGASYYQWLMTEYTVPEELFGAVKLTGLEEGRFVRNTTNKLPEANLVFLDEVYKANSSILNTLLTAMNEKMYFNDTQVVKMPLISLIGASNEYADEEENLEALDDRFQLRYVVEEIQESSNFKRLLQKGNKIEIPKIKLEDIISIQKEVDNIAVSEDIVDIIDRIRVELAEEDVNVSTRRWVQSLNILRAEAAYQERKEISVSDLSILNHVLWKNPKDSRLVKSVISKYCIDTFADCIKKIKKEKTEIEAEQIVDDTTVLEKIKQLKTVQLKARELLQSYTSPEKEASIKEVIDEIDQSILKITETLFV